MNFNDPRSIAGGIAIINRKSTPYSDIPLPKFVTDPLYTSSQDQLDKLGTGLLKGDVPDYYKSIGDFNSPQFQAMLNSVKGQIMQGSQEASAIQGTGRSGVATTASNNALNSVIPQLSYQDYVRAMNGRGALLDTGINVEGGVRASAQQQGLNESLFNQDLFNDQIHLAGLNDSYKKEAAAAEGAFYGNIGTALLGQNVGNILSGGISSSGGVAPGTSFNSGGSNLSSLFDMLGKMNTGSGGGAQNSSYGVSDPSLGSFKSLSSLNSSNPEIATLLSGGL
jgi:hypothetical protein